MNIIAPLLVVFALGMVCLTDPQGVLGVWIERSQVVAVEHPIDCAKGSNTKVTLGNGSFVCVHETIKETLGKLDQK